MSYKSSREAFEQAQQIAESSGDSAMEFVAAGLADLVRALASDLRDIEQRLKAVESKVRSIC